MNISGINFRGVSAPKQLIKNEKINPEEKTLERTPEQDTVAFRGKDGAGVNKGVNKGANKGVNISCRESDDMRYDIVYTKPSFWKNGYEMKGENVEFSVGNNGFTGSRKVTGKGYGQDYDLQLTTRTFNLGSGRVTGRIGDKPVDIKYAHNGNFINIKGSLEGIQGKNKALLMLLISDKVKDAIKADREAALAMAMMS